MNVRRSAALPAPAPETGDAQSAQVLSGRYRLGVRIGSGGMADVYEAIDTRLCRPVAVKVFRPGSGPATEDRLAAEAVLLARLEHPGLVGVYDSGCHDDRGYLVMRLIDGPTLRGLLTRGSLTEQRAAELGTALARALAHVHRAGIVHRDVKPSNVLLDTAGNPHLADFGIARLTNATRRTEPDALTGTAAYLAPEQVEGRHVGPPTDVYALGLVLLECLKGELEYQGTPLEAAIARLHRPPTFPAWLAPDLADLLHAMTARAPEARPDAEYCAMLLGSLNLEPEGGTEDARNRTTAVTAPRVPDRPRPRRRLALGTALAALSVALGTAFTVAAGTGEHHDDHADATSSAAHPPAGTAAPESGRGPGSPPGSARTATPSAGSPTDPALATADASGGAALTRQGSAGHRGAGAPGQAAHGPGGKNDPARPTPYGAAVRPDGTPPARTAHAQGRLGR
ncbi:protein kinase [Streptomyces sp. NPDC101225]|uniref:serine/threonine-protein kinase n=1 Tax=Streptomyces sp. NPDC101225 TaxID=3366135 RepID=UPI00382BAED7